MAHWINLGEAVRVNAAKYADKEALADASRCFTWRQVDARCDSLACALIDMGLKKGDKVAALLENCIEIIELYIAAARAGVVVVPINFRLVGDEVAYVADHSDAKAFFVHDMFARTVEQVRSRLPKIPAEAYVLVSSSPLVPEPAGTAGPSPDRERGAGCRNGTLNPGKLPQSYRGYEELLASTTPRDPGVKVLPQDTWIMLYTSGTTGVPKGVVRSHESYVAFYLINGIDFRFCEDDVCLNIMPLCHVNSTFFTLNVSYVGGKVFVHPASGFEAEKVLRIIDKEKITFISLVPTHYRMILSVPEEQRQGLDFASLKKLLCSSAPATVEMKQDIMRFFSGVDLYEGYGSTEAGIVTVLKPHEQFTKPGSIGRESTGTSQIKILDENRQPVPAGVTGELYSRGPMLLDCYYKMPDRTRDSFAGEWFTARDMAYRDTDGYYFLVDRKDNMIITGGEKVFPSEVEAILLSHPAVFDAAVVGLPDPKWGEVVTAVAILKQNIEACEQELLDYCRGKVAGFKRPRKILFIPPEEMPRTPTGKILHRQLRIRFRPAQP